MRNVAQLIAIVRDAGDLRLPNVARQVLQVLAAQLEHIEAAIAALEKQLMLLRGREMLAAASEHRIVPLPQPFGLMA